MLDRLPLDNGRLALPEGIARQFGGDVGLASWSTRHLLLGKGDVLLAGRLGALAVADLLSFLNMFRKSGQLHVAIDGGAKDLFFVDGEIVHAASTLPDEDLGEFLVAGGALDRELLLKARQKGGHDCDSLRRILLETGMVSPKDLWAALLAQVETVIYRLIPATRGDFAFIDAAVAREELPGFVLGTQNLIMEGLRRADERALFMRKIPSLDALPVPTGKAAEQLTEAEARILALAQGGRSTVRDIQARSGAGEFDGLRLLHRLVERGLVRIEPPRPAAVSRELAELIVILNGALAELHRRIAPLNHGFGLEMRRFLRDLPQPLNQVFRHADLGADGTVDSDRIAANLAGLEEIEGRRLLVDAMNELLFAACHAARRDLGDAGSSALVQRVSEIGRRAAQLAERKRQG